MLATPASESSSALASAHENDRRAYNVAFLELELGWAWDARTYDELLDIPEEKDRICAYIQRYHPHLLRAYEAAFLCNLIYETKRRCQEDMAHLA
jgi:hypothetical protein